MQALWGANVTFLRLAKMVTQIDVTVEGGFPIVLIMMGIQNRVIVTNTMNVTLWEENHYEKIRDWTNVWL